MENLRKKINIRLMSDAGYFLKYTSRPTYTIHKILVRIMLLFMKLNQF